MEPSNTLRSAKRLRDEPAAAGADGAVIHKPDGVEVAQDAQRKQQNKGTKKARVSLRRGLAYTPDTEFDDQLRANDTARALQPAGEVAEYALREKIIACVKDVNFERAVALVQEAIASGLTPSQHIFGMILAIATKLTKVETSVIEGALKVWSQFESSGMPVNENSYSLIIKVCALGGNPSAGRKILYRMIDAKVEPRLRSYSGLIEAFALAGDLESIRGLFDHMQQYKVEPEQPDYAHLLRVLRSKGLEREGVALLRSIIDKVHVLGPELADAVKCFFSPSTAASPLTSTAASLTTASASPAAPSEASDNAAGWPWRCTHVMIDRSDGVCPVTGKSLRSLDLTEVQFREAAEQCRTLASKGRHEADNERAQQDFDAFAAWLSRNGPFDVIIDGANVGFFGQNFNTGGLCYSQVDAIARHFEALGHRVLIVMSAKWLQSKWFSNEGMRKPFKRKFNHYEHRRLEATGGQTRNASTSSAAAGSAPVATDDVAVAEPTSVSNAAAQEGSDGGGASMSASSATGASSSSAAPAPPVAQSATSASSSASTSSSPPREAPKTLTWRPGKPKAGGAGSASSSSAAASNMNDSGGAYGDDADGGDTSSYDSDTGSIGKGSSTVGRKGPSAPSSSTSAAAGAAGGPQTDIEFLAMMGTDYDTHESTVAWDAGEDTKRAQSIIAGWRGRNMVYSVPRGNNDDWFWMYAAVSHPEPHKVRLISNDFMRDHHFQLLHADTFQTWRERHQVLYAFARYGRPLPKMDAHARLHIKFPLRHSHRLQTSEDGSTWHFPLELPAQGRSNVWIAAWQPAALAASGAAAASNAHSEPSSDPKVLGPSLPPSLQALLRNPGPLVKSSKTGGASGADDQPDLA